MPRVDALISVRSVDEALLAAAAGVRLIDCKEPRDGALGALPLDVVAQIVAVLRGRDVEVSATVGDAPGDVAAAVRRTLARGVDVVKVGVAEEAALDALAVLAGRVVPVLLVDRRFDDRLVQAACERFATLMFDTADKASGSVFDALPFAALQRSVANARRRGRRIGIAGALRERHLPLVAELQPDYAGFRGAVCDGDERGGALSAARLHALLAKL